MHVKCKCEYCKKDIVVEVPKDDVLSDDFDCTLGNSCNDCIPENSAARDGINESIYIEAKTKKKKNWNDKLSTWMDTL